MTEYSKASLALDIFPGSPDASAYIIPLTMITIVLTIADIQISTVTTIPRTFMTLFFSFGAHIYEPLQPSSCNVSTNPEVGPTAPTIEGENSTAKITASVVVGKIVSRLFILFFIIYTPRPT